ncbi:hypothetical protein EN839_34275, partial [Mesorhizobium sp. M1C.F.Ca.ET.196.01.1.1]|uniref:hypothetical protein n=1 Tax=Mesorhizobium sp. M1C.F.Ca.ET.196.01.1.1 TaxID=2563928 RepID=UPI001092E96C
YVFCWLVVRALGSYRCRLNQTGIYARPPGLQAIAGHVHGLADRLASGLKAAGVAVLGASRFDTVTAQVKGKAVSIAQAAEKTGRLLRVIDADHVSIAFDETS